VDKGVFDCLKFECKMCGACCRNMRGRTYEKHERIPRVFMAVPPSLRTIGLFEWEVSLLEEKAKELSLSFKAKPDIIFWDELNKIPIVTQWNLDHDNCPFLSNENRCRIHKQKPLICQAYPLMAFGILSGDISSLTRVGLADCPNAVPLPFAKGVPIKIKPSIVFRQLFQAYGSSFLGMLRLDIVTKLLRESLENLLGKGLIRPALLKKKVVKAILRNEPIGLLEYLRNKCPDIERELKEHIESIYEVDITFLKRLIEEG